MNITQQTQINAILSELFSDAKNDYLKMMKGAARSLFRPMRPADFEEAYLSISKEQGEDLVRLIQSAGIKNVVEFGTSFGISTLYLAQGVLATGGKVITTELLASKAEKARDNFRKADVADLIEVRTGDAMETLQDHCSPIDLLLLDGWKDLYLPLFRLLEPNFHSETIVYVDNADMAESRQFLQVVGQNPTYQVMYQYSGKVALVTVR